MRGLSALESKHTKVMDIFSLLALFSLLTFSLFLIFYYPRAPSQSVSKGLKTYPLIGNLPAFIKNRHRFLDWLTEILSGHPTNTVTITRPGLRAVVTANPSNVEYMLKTNFDNYPKGHRFISLLEDFLGHGIFNSDGELWKIQRKTASFEFNTKSLRNFVMDSVRSEIQDRLMPLLEKASKSDRSIDSQDVLERFAFDNVCKVAFNVDPKCLSEEAADDELLSQFALAFDTATNLSSNRFWNVLTFLWRIKKFFNVGTEKQVKVSISIVHDFAAKIIRSRKNDNSPPDDDLLSRFIANKDNSDEFLRDIVVSFILAGRDTTSSALSRFFWLLSSRPDVQQKIVDELKMIRSKTQTIGETFTFEELREMHYLHAAISEAMRLYPPVAIDTKACLKDDIFPDGTFVGKGSFVTYHAYAMGRMESIWGKDARSFMPERWIENGVFKQENPYKYPVFNAGPRICLGKEMAYIQMKSIAASVLERFEVDVVGKDTSPEPVLSLTLKMKGGLPVQVKERNLNIVN